MPNITKSSTAKFMIHANYVLDYLENAPEVSNELGRYGLAIHQLPEGRQKYEEVNRLILECETQAQAQKTMNDQFKNEWEQLASLHRVHLYAARQSLGDELQHILGPCRQSYAGWASDVGRFYGVILSNDSYTARLNRSSIPTEELLRAKQWLTSLVANKNQQSQNQQDLRLLQEQRDLKLKEFKRWFEVVGAAARAAFRYQPVMRQLVSPRLSQVQIAAKVLPPPPVNGASVEQVFVVG